MSQVMERRVFHEFRRRDGWLPDVPVVVVAAQQGALGGPAHYVRSVQAEPVGMSHDSAKDEARHRNLSQRCRRLGLGQDGMTIHDDDLLVNGDHSGCRVNPVERKAECLALT